MLPGTLWSGESELILIGVTGGVGTGKSTVARLFGKLGARVIDADRITHGLMEPGRSVWKKIRSFFGDTILTADNKINRKELAKRVFGKPILLKRLNGMIHPVVRRVIREKIRSIRKREPNAVVVLDVPLLIEAGSAYRVDALVVVSSPMSQVARRLRSRSGWSESEIRRRQSFQMPLRRKEKKADFVVKNQGSLAATRRQVKTLWEKIVKGEKEHA